MALNSDYKINNIFQALYLGNTNIFSVLKTTININSELVEPKFQKQH